MIRNFLVLLLLANALFCPVRCVTCTVKPAGESIGAAVLVDSASGCCVACRDETPASPARSSDERSSDEGQPCGCQDCFCDGAYQPEELRINPADTSAFNLCTDYFQDHQSQANAHNLRIANRGIIGPNMGPNIGSRIGVVARIAYDRWLI
jgi:hypothetical protein